ncbi:hypothetical protein DW322_06705 [Rhodococcus rhodnii]|uniref:Uncharacterized protein n=2 Tax=Rhodococcus rhodnii TaxID=38312 RepID=R7WJ63_9NOCA|nr:hypothetical protein [Rhodococcus rhodnii]EOM75301.1 hypothetical protein Rrhod_3358 [Rhodococcus rhodnii LMG 5362]TXG89958.1 hypothetical protein DW322_06705 [Rhodococcus rhodnii]
MARGEHPQRTPLYGVLLIVAAMLGSLAVYRVDAPTWLQILVYLAAVAAGVTGFVMTFRDYGH